jgi:hypothetical protein
MGHHYDHGAPSIPDDAIEDMLDRIVAFTTGLAATHLPKDELHENFGLEVENAIRPVLESFSNSQVNPA